MSFSSVEFRTIIRSLLLAATLSSCSFIKIGSFSGDSEKPAPLGIRSVLPSQNSDGYLVKGRYFVPSAQVNRLPDIKLIVTPEVKKELDSFTQKRRSSISRAVEQRGEYDKALKQIFQDEGVPADLINVALLESGFDADAESPAGAKGMWQFMKSTARYYGLKIGFFEDQRKDPILASLAAARHLRDLYMGYQDWYLALAAYNAGPGGVDKAIKAGGSRDFWTLARRGQFTDETASFVPRFIAATIIMKDLKAFGFDDGKSSQG